MAIASDLNKELDKYIAGRRETRTWTFFSSKAKKNESDQVPEDLKADSVHILPQERGSFWERLFGGGKVEPPVAEDLSPEEMKRLEAMQEAMQEIEKEESRHPERYPELERERENLFDRFLNLFRGYERQHRLEQRAEELEFAEEEIIPQMDEDVKEVLKIMHKWLGKLSKRERDNFKASPDYERYKEILERYGLAKNKATVSPPPKMPVSKHGTKNAVHMKEMESYPTLRKK